ncbi:MAG: hypothetical protein VXV95_05770, partial [Candidatus Thermoplasmatota archaeon]|nr:hypothetical protein [Candidatus Thermoplasmatota archaeon]
SEETFGRGRLTVQRNGPRPMGQLPQYREKKGGFAAPVGTHNTHEFSFTDLQVDVMKDRDAGAINRDVADIKDGA